jgi:hypothetical protein
VPVGRAERLERRLGSFERRPAGFIGGFESGCQHRHCTVAAAETDTALRTAGIGRCRCWGIMPRGKKCRSIGTGGRRRLHGFRARLRRRRVMRVPRMCERRFRRHEIGRNADREGDESAPEHRRTLCPKRREPQIRAGRLA